MCAAARPHRNAVARGKLRDTANVVAVLVGDEDGINVCGQNIGQLQQLQQAGQAACRNRPRRDLVLHCSHC